MTTGEEYTMQKIFRSENKYYSDKRAVATAQDVVELA